MKTIGIILLGSIIFFVVSKAEAQLKQYFPDSIIYYSLRSTDTASKVPLRKELFKYDKDFSLVEKTMFRWDLLKNKWLLEAKFSLSYRKNEIHVEKYVIENEKNEILVARNIAVLDDKGEIIETTSFNKDRYSDKHDRRNKFEYEYKKDTLVTMRFFEQSTTFFLKKQIKYQFLYNKMLILEKTFSEIDGSIVEKSTEGRFEKGLLVSRSVLEKASNELVAKDSFLYSNGVLTSLISTAYAVNKEKKSKSKDASISNYEYDGAGQLKSIATLKLDEHGKPKNHHTNTYKRYFISEKSTIKPPRLHTIDLTNMNPNGDN